MDDITRQLTVSALSPGGIIIGAAIAYFIEKQRQKHEKGLRQIEEIESIYLQVALSLLKRYRDAVPVAAKI